MTTSPEWGDVLLTGPQMKALRDAGMPGDVLVAVPGVGTFPAAQWALNNPHEQYLLPSTDPSYLCHVHNEANGTSFKPWYGGDEAPGDVAPSSEVLLRSDDTIDFLDVAELDWSHGGNDGDIIGYHALPKQEEAGEGGDEVPEWAKERAAQLILADPGTVIHYDSRYVGRSNVGRSFARYIAQHEQPPVDPDLIEAREIVRKHYPEMQDGYSGRRLTIAREALKRGRELELSK